MSENNVAENNELVVIEGALKGFDKIRAGFALMEKNYKGVLFDVETPLGMAHAKAARAAIRKPRFEVENLRKGAKAPLLALGRRLDAVAAKLTEDLLAIENPIVEQIDYQEEKLEKERLAQVAAEAARKVAIEGRIQEIRNAITRVPGNADADTIRAKIESVRAIEVDDSFAEYQTQAQDAQTAALARLAELHGAAVEREAEKKRIADQLALLAKLQAENAARERAEAEERKRKEAEIHAAKAAQEAADKAKRDEQERLDREAREKADAIAKAEREAALAVQEEANRVERERIAEEDRVARVQREAEAAKAAEVARLEREDNERIARERQEALDKQEAEARAKREEEEAAALAVRQAQEAESARLAAEKADLDRRAEELRKANEPKPLVLSKSQMKRLQAQAPTKKAIIAAVAKSFKVTETVAQVFLSAHDWRETEAA